MARPARSRARAQELGESRRFIAFVVFVVAAFAMGGGARDDITSLLLLRPLAVGFAAYAWLAARPGEFIAIRGALWLLGALAGLCLVQLIPLPPGLWHALPGREGIAARDGLLGLQNLWRPLSLAPSKTLNSLVSLSVPLAALLLAALQPARRRPAIVLTLAAIALTSALLGLIQVVGPNGGPLYLYRVTNPESAVGLFANRNHHAAFLAAVFPLLAWYLRHGPPADWQNPRSVPFAAAGLTLLWTIVIVISGSRAGLGLFSIAMALAATIFWRGARDDDGKAPKNLRRGGGAIARRRFNRPAVVAAAIVAFGVTLVWLVPYLPAYQRFVADDVAGDIRFTALPTILEIARATFPVGAGLGSFEHVFKIYEPAELLKSTYLNQAHDDVLQLAVEAGLAGLLILAAAVVMLVRRGLVIAAWLGTRDSRAWAAAAALSGLALLGAASIVDYPLRAPSLMVFAAVLTTLTLHPRSRPAATSYVESSPAMG